VSKGSVNDYLRRADEAGMTWERARKLNDGALESQLFTAVNCRRGANGGATAAGEADEGEQYEAARVG